MCRSADLHTSVAPPASGREAVMSKKSTAARKSIRRPRQPSVRQIDIVSQTALPHTRHNPILGTVHTKAANDGDVELFSERAPAAFNVKAIFQREDSYLWIGIDPGKAPGDNIPITVIKGDALRALVTEYLKHFNAGLFAERAR
jgi:hypothetical protein